MPREPQPPAKGQPITPAERMHPVFHCAVQWRRYERANYPELAAAELDKLREAIADFEAWLSSPPTSPPPPRKQHAAS